MSTIFSGQTLYNRTVDEKGREHYVPRGYTLADAAYCWRLKQDPASGKYFFVNAGGMGKKWKLPDLADPSFQQELRKHLSSSSHQPVQPQRQRDGAYDPLVFHSPVVVAGPGPRITEPPSVTVGNAIVVERNDVFDYNDAEWRMEEARRLHRERMKLLDDDLRQQTAAEKRAMESMAAQPLPPLSIPVHEDPGALYTASAAPLEVMMELQHQREAQAQREQSIRQAEAQLQIEREMLQEQRQRDKQVIEALEQQQLESIRSSAHHRTTPSQDLGQFQRPAASLPTGRASHSDSLRGHPVARTTSPSDKSETQRLTAVIETLQKLLEHERERNERLQRQLDERDRVAMEHVLADAEREQREIMMRVRMVEAIAAYRKEDELAVDDKARDETETAEDVRGRLKQRVDDPVQRRQSSSRLPRHPLDDGED